MHAIMNWDLSLLNHIDDFLQSHVHVSKNSNAHKLQRVTDKVGNRHILDVNDVNSISMNFTNENSLKRPEERFDSIIK